MSATPRSARLSTPGQIVAILVSSAAISVALLVTIGVLFFTVLIPTLQFGGRGEIPGDFPVYPGAQLQAAFATRLADCTTVTASWSSPDGIDAVAGFYKRELAVGPWTLTDSQQRLRSIYFDFQSTGEPHREGVLTLQAGYRSGTQISLELVKSSPGVVGQCYIVTGTVGS